MKKSEFLKRLSQAALRMAQEYNHPNTDKKTFEWSRQSVYYARVCGVYLDTKHGPNIDNPVAKAVKQVALGAREGSIITLEVLVAIEEAYEYFQEQERLQGESL